MTFNDLYRAIAEYQNSGDAPINTVDLGAALSGAKLACGLTDQDMEITPEAMVRVMRESARLGGIAVKLAADDASSSIQ